LCSAHGTLSIQQTSCYARHKNPNDASNVASIGVFCARHRVNFVHLCGEGSARSSEVHVDEQPWAFFGNRLAKAARKNISAAESAALFLL
jgi:hypothetical protein